MIWRELCLLLGIALAVIGLADCGGSTVEREVGQSRKFVDDLGREVSIPDRVDRAISLAPNLTESIFAVGAGDRLVGVTSYCNFPGEALGIAKVGDTQTPNVERVIALEPQIVLVSTASQLEAFTQTLAAQNISVYVTNPQSLEDVTKNLRQFGSIFGTDEKAAYAIADIERRAAAVEDLHADSTPVPVFLQISREPLYTVGKESFLTEVVRRAGGSLVTRDIERAFPVLSKETALALRPEAIILSDSPDNLSPNDAFRNSRAVGNGKVCRVNADILSRPGPRLVNAMEAIAKCLHS